MAGKKKKKEKKTKSGSLSHIGASLFPSAIFAAASPSLASTWPRRSASPIAKAVGEAGIVGQAFLGDMNRTYSAGSSQLSPVHRPPVDLPSASGHQAEESAYESVDVGPPGYDKTSKFAKEMDNNGNSSYHVIGEDKEKDDKPEPVYARVNKSKKKSARQATDNNDDSNLYDDVADDVSIVISSDDDLTDVTSNDEESSTYTAVKRSSKRSQKDKKTKPVKVQRKSTEESVSEEHSHHDYDDNAFESPRHENDEGESKKKSSKRSLHLSKKHNSIDAVDGVHSEHQSSEPNEGHYTSSGFKRGSKKASLKKRSQVAPGEDTDTTTHSNSKERQLERLGFEGTSQKVELSDISEDEEAFSLRAYHPSKSSDKKTRRRIINEEVQMMQSEENALEGPNSSLFDIKPRDGQKLSKESPLRYQQSGDMSVSMLDEQKKQLEQLIRQQEDVFRQQAQQQKEQQSQAMQLAQQQLELQKQLQHLEQIQKERLDSSFDHTLPKDVAEQQENFFRLQQQQQAKYENQQERVLSQQQNICDQIKELEYQQRQLQSNISMLSPKETDLAEIRWQEKEIIRLLNEQQSHQEDYDKLHKLQQKQLEEQTALFQQERKVLETQQEALLTKIKEQEEKSKQLEIELHSLSAKPTKKVRHSRHKESEDEITESQLDEVDAVPVPHTNPSPRSNKKTKKPHKIPISSSIDMLQLENSRLSELNVSLQKENHVLRKFSESVEKGTGGESLVTQQYIKDLQQEVKVLQDTVHRLNVELNRFQMKYRQATVEEVDSLVFPKSTGSCPWLVNTKFLAPLFVAYDDRLKEKDDVIKVYDEEMTAFKARLMDIVKENQDLHMRIAKSKPDALVLDEWQQLQEQAKLVVEENSLLMKQQALQQRKIKEMHQMHGQDVSKLSMRITNLESEKKTLKTQLEDIQCSYNTLLQKYETLVEQDDKKIPVEEHLAIMEECRSIMEDMKASKNSETEQMESKVEAIKQEKQNLAMDLTDCKAQVSQLTKELEIHRKTQRKLERKNVLLERKLEHIFEREITAQQTLDEVLKIAEKTAEERDSFEEFAKTQELKQKRSKSLLHQGDISIIGLKEKLKINKRKSSERLALITGQLDEKEKEVNKIKVEHEREINRLRALVREKQKAIEEMMGEKRMFDQQLDEVWKKADQETQLMKKSIQEDRITGSPGH